MDLNAKHFSRDAFSLFFEQFFPSCVARIQKRTRSCRWGKVIGAGGWWVVGLGRV